jgi:hypothetical protein
MEVRKKRPRGFKKEAQGVQVSPLDPLSIAPRGEPGVAMSSVTVSASATPATAPAGSLAMTRGAGAGARVGAAGAKAAAAPAEQQTVAAAAAQRRSIIGGDVVPGAPPGLL